MEWDYAKDVPPDFDQMRKREDRKEKIVPYWDLLVNDKEPKLDKHSLMRLMKDLKDEGNALFKEGHYDIAWMHYRNALFVARILENRYYHQVDKEFVSTLFSNKAFCCLKKEMYDEAVRDCESAIQIYSNNLKAYYRQAVAYKHQRKYKEAMKAAEKGQQIQQSSTLKDLIDELQSHLEPDSKKKQGVGATAEVSAKGGSSPFRTGTVNDEPDADWLAGTNVGVTEKSKAKMPSKKSKKSKAANKNSEPVKSNGRNYTEGPGSDSDGSNSSLGEDDAKFANSLKSVRRQRVGRKDVLNIGCPKVPEEDSAWTFPHDADGNVDTSQLKISQSAAAVGSKFGRGGMGLDSFPASSRATEIITELDSTTDSSSRRSSRSSQSPIKTSSGSSSPFVKQSSPASKPNTHAIPTITFPLADDYRFRLACRSCFVKFGEGIKGFKYTEMNHTCTKDLLIIRLKDKPDVHWIKVRARPEAQFYGPYKICTQFSQGYSCKVGEENCSFPHHQAELKLWSFDREKRFLIEDFVAKLRKYQIDTSEILEEKSRKQYIPGLIYAADKGKKNKTVNQHIMSPPTTGEPAHAPPQQQKKAAGNQGNQRTGTQYSIQQAPPQNRYTDMSIRPPPHSYSGMYPPPQHQYMGQYQGPRHQYMPPNFAGPFSQPPPNYYQHGGQMGPQTYRRQAPTVIKQPVDQPAEVETSVETLNNPLADTHDVVIACGECLKPSQISGVFEWRQLTHKCEENMLAMREKDRNANMWFRVRERKNHREFPGNYILCRSITIGDPRLCRYGEDGCSFAHNEVEQYLWTCEKDGVFNITEFLIRNRKQAAQKGFNLREVMLKHGGYFEFICRGCYFDTPPRITREGEGNKCSGDIRHKWSDYKILAHMGASSGEVIVINTRGFLHKTAFFKICKWLHFCRQKVNAECRFAHSMVERDVWMLERDTDLKRSEIVEQSKAERRSAGSTSAESLSATGKTAPSTTTEETVFDTVYSGDNECPFIAQQVCETCWKQGQKSEQEGKKDRCQKGHANWSCNKVCLTSPSNKEVRALPRKIPGNLNFIICKYVREKNKCGYVGGGPCQFAHSSEELDIWKWMCLNTKTTLESLIEASKTAQKKRAEAAKPKISGKSVVAVAHGSLGVSAIVRPAMPVGNFSTHYCHYCGITCNSQKQWDEHCASEKHTFNVNSDKEHQWNFRQPPWGIGARSYELCPKHNEGFRCQYSNVPDMYNLCRFAHSPEELDEWKERYEWRLMKREMARQEKVFSYMDQLVEKYEDSESSVKVISETLEGVDVCCMGELHVYKEEKIANHTWTFDISTDEMTLQKVSMLYNRDRLHFSIVEKGKKSAQIAQGDVFKLGISDTQYCVEVLFTGGMFGSFQQWVIFDFGVEPVLCRKITVEVGTKSSHDKVRSLRKQLQFDRWTSQNREIVFHESTAAISLEDKLSKRYKEPSSSESVVSQSTVLTELNRHNYVLKMHKLIDLEEITRHQIISSYNMCTDIQCLQSIEEGVFVYAHPGELFAKVPLQENLTEDTDAGKLILTSVRTVLLAPKDNADKVIYEASIVREENFNFDGRGRDYIYLCLSPQCVEDLKLQPGEVVNVEIQFQMNRLAFCRMHYAVDELKSTDLIFPDVPKINPMRNEKHSLRITSHILNPDQMATVRHIVAERTGYTPPFIIFGPFGTGKTETIAQAAMILLKERPDTKILICAQSNSAADLYITEHLDSFLKKSNLTSKLRRVYFRERRTYTVSTEVKKYCTLSSDGSSFEIPDVDDIRKQRIVIVTVNTALTLTDLALQGHFTHIFIDEAAQSFECETLMPLSLATEKTCVVLAGDHMQISPKVFSSEAKNQRFHISLLERLYNYYDSHSSLISVANPLNILLRINYRTKMEILRFISAIFYGGPDKLISEANIPSVLGITPLIFYSVQGRDIQDENSISYYNMSEVQEVVERVDELLNKWPEQWGEVNPKKIGVVTPYYDQVQLIRRSLKKKRNPMLKDVVVERIHNVQGKEFRALFLSTVRTSHLLDAPHIQNAGLASSVSECDGDGGDFGFLSDSKLLNTALTRAQSLVVTVGDPVALCAIGECVNVWRTYLKHCQNMGSLFPHSHTFESIRQQVQNLLNSPVRERLLQIANARQQQNAIAASSTQRDLSQSGASKMNFSAAASGRKVDTPPTVPPSPPRQSTLAQPQPSMSVTGMNAGGIKYEQLSASVQQSLAPVGNPQSPLKQINTMYPPPPIRPPAPLRMIPQKKQTVLVEVGDEPSGIESSDILLQLARVSIAEGSSGSLLGLTQTLSLSCIHFNEESGHAVLYHTSTNGHSTGTSNKVINYDLHKLQELLSKKPQTFKAGTLRIEAEGIFVELKDDSDMRIIQIGTRSFCGQAFHQDLVVVEILKSRIRQHDTLGPSYADGQVVGVLERFLDPTFKLYVCTADKTSSGIMVPINEKMPRLYNTITPGCLQNCVDGKVCVYRITTDKQIRFSHYEAVDQNNPAAPLFAVRFLRWDADLQLPVGVVIGTLPAGVNVSTGMRLLDIEHNIPRRFEPETLAEVEHTFYPGYQLPNDFQVSRIDLRDRWSFSIDSLTAEDVDVAFNIDENPDGSYLIGVHVSDVAYFVEKGSCIDTEAFRRGSSTYPLNKKPVHMLPNQLSTDLCSLKPNTDRVTLSVLMTVQSTGEVSGAMVQKTIINTKKKFSYQEAEEVLQDPNAHEDYLKSCVLVLYQISRFWRKERLGNAYTYQDLTSVEQTTPHTRQMVSEMMIMTDHQVSKVLINRYPHATPLFVQSPPNLVRLNVWKQEHAADAVNSIALTKPFLEGPATCKCKLACTCIINYIQQCNMKVRDHVDVNSSLWDTLTQVADINGSAYTQNLIVAAENHPQLARALLKLLSIQSCCRYLCSSDVSGNDVLHYSLNRSPYTHFTQPLRRYIDLVVQRMMNACINNLPCPYSTLEMQKICLHISRTSVQAKAYEEAVHQLYLSSALKAKPLVLHPILAGVAGKVELQYPTVPDINSVQQSFDVSLLGPTEVSTPISGDATLILKWQERVYDIPGTHIENSSNSGELNNNRFIYKVPGFQWQKLLIAVREENLQRLNMAVDVVRKQVCNPALEGNYIDDVTSEIKKLGKLRHFAEFWIQFQPNTVIQTQLSADVRHGILTPTVQLVSLTPSLDVCIEHRSNPALCFVDTSSQVNTRAVYHDDTAYQQTWLPILNLESVCRAVESEERVVIRGVSMTWRTDGSRFNGNSNSVYAQFSLPLLFLKERQVKIFNETQIQELFMGSDKRSCQNYFADFFCVRYGNLSLPVDPALNDSVAQIVNNAHAVCWVGHCVIVSVAKNNDLLTFNLKLHHSAVAVPDELLQTGRHNLHCTVEFVLSTRKDRKLLHCVQSIGDSSVLARDVAFGRIPSNTVHYRDVEGLRQLSMSVLQPENAEQLKALEHSLGKPFTVVQGGPATGKSELAVKLSVLYAKRNLTSGQMSTPTQVLLCAPNDTALDILSGYLLSLESRCPRVVRVYEEEVVHKVYPVIGEVAVQRSSLVGRNGNGTAVINPHFKSIALHEVIRQPSCPHHQAIQEFDTLFTLYPDDLSEDQLEEYNQLVSAAEATVLKNCDIILTTCSNSVSSKISRVVNVHQLIIDDCNMCTELEGLLPLVEYKSIQQVTLIGDENQMKPSVTNQRAARLGMDMSLISRYRDRAVHLVSQYRVHEGIMEFPNKVLYGDNLKTGSLLQRQPSVLTWPGGRDRPLAFCHISGAEGSQEGRDRPNSQSILYNESQADLTVRITHSLVSRFQVSEGNIAVLSPFKEQCEFVTKKLLQTGQRNITVKTVQEAQGGQWDYILLSTVRSQPVSKVDKIPSSTWRSQHLGILADSNLVSVALTRCQKGLIIIGNKHLLACDELWNKLLLHYDREKKLVSADQFLQEMSM